eukprot:CAMPEP_0174260686 /NCGR_PEP_ID=MMETSP0439-20130205/10283_1 /TAXON_ID=0 /ORGANISM="Stereomyxa ramosa, Strain Chinc5" /LENGTH=96 /DNA_ID=CAMNT_0015344985 /DNA_START=24 /DNA_END=314 /DNA_ORIENTATION=+
MSKANDLVMFYGEGCPFTKRVAPEVNCLEKYLSSLSGNPEKILKLEIYENEKNREEFLQAGRNKCNGVPFFYNKKTGDYICGATSCENLKKWADKK